MKTIIKIPTVVEEEKTPTVMRLLEVIEQQFVIIKQQAEEIQQLKDEIAQLKMHKSKPKIRPSRLEQSPKGENDLSDGKRPGSSKRSKTKELKIHHTVTIAPDDVPEGSTFKSYQEYIVQDIEIKTNNFRYLLERWQTPEGSYIIGKLPESVQGSHFGATLQSYILYQYYQCHVTQPLLLEQLREWAIEISSGQLNRILSENKELFHREKEKILSVGLKVSSYINVDDTGARHQGNNGYSTHIGNEFFAWFESTGSKSRINFLQLLRAGHSDYVLNDDAVEYMQQQGLPKYLLLLFKEQSKKSFADKLHWEAYLNELGISRPGHIKTATEGTLLGSVLSHGVPKSLVIVSDDAGQFNILNHALCWIHAERAIDKIIPYNDEHREAIEEIRKQLWQFYNELKAYKVEPNETKKAQLEARFDSIFTTNTSSVALNRALEHIHQNKAELLLVLQRPEIPLHNNLSERDIREYVKRRKVSGSTRSEPGRCSRDTFTSLKKTCRKLQISFWQYLNDRVSKANLIPNLSELIQCQASQASVPG